MRRLRERRAAGLRVIAVEAEDELLDALVRAGHIDATDLESGEWLAQRLNELLWRIVEKKL